jgi:hypothetical protein
MVAAGQCVDWYWLETKAIPPQFVQVACVLVAFGFSDVVEIQTGAWWRPWWLLVWKGACLLAMLGMWWYRPKK